MRTVKDFNCYSWLPQMPDSHGESALDSDRAMHDFLQNVEKRALKIAELAVSNRDDAMEIVQDAMLGLVKRYRSKPSDQWKPLFYRILHSRINDFYRRRAVRQRVMSFMPGGGSHTFDTESTEREEPIERASAGERENPSNALQREINNKAMLAAIAELPLRQQQAFMLRAWEGLSVADTACSMHCSEGSVKTHYSRALSALRTALTDIAEPPFES